MRIGFWTAATAALVLVLAGGGEDPTETLTLADVEAAWREAGLEVGERHRKLAGLLGAIDGGAIEVNGNRVEVYQWNLSVESGREALEGIVQSGVMGAAVHRHGNLGLLDDVDHPDWPLILEAFNSIGEGG